jgi:Glucanosyltransferase
MSKITQTDRVIVVGKFLVYERNPRLRFRMRGLAFPVPHVETYYNEDGWIGILKQLRKASPELNTLRLYHIHPGTTMTRFYQAAADLGFYLLVPLTSAQGNGVLNRDDDAPNCYRPELYHYGAQVIDSVRDHPNVLGGILGNEVMNSLADWPAAPCILAYARDLKRYAPGFPLIYTTQHDGITAEVNPAQTVKLMLDYLTCHSNSTATIDILGVNIESWCSSLGTFETNEDGTMGSYLDLYDHLLDSTIPLIFSELGCGQNYFDRDNGLGTPLGDGDHLKAREWQQVHVVENNMVDEFSGFLAYAYDGPVNFRMTTGGPWDGMHPLEFNLDMKNYLQALMETSSDLLPAGDTTSTVAPSCPSVHAFLQECCHLDLLDVDQLPSYYDANAAPQLETIPSISNQHLQRDIMFYPIILPLLMTVFTLYCVFQLGYRSVYFPQEQTEMTGDPQKSYSTFA